MRILSPEVQANRQLFLEGLRSGQHCKGTTVTDDRGRPVDPHGGY